MPPCTTRRTATNLKTKNNQNCQTIELNGSLTTKELKKKYSFKLVGGAARGSWGREEMQQGGILRTAAGEGWLVDWAVPHLHVNKPGGTTRERDRPCYPMTLDQVKLKGPVQGNKASKSLSDKTCGG